MELLFLLAKHVPLKQWAFDDSNSPKYQKFKEFPKDLLFVSNDYPVYPLAANMFKQYTDFDFSVTQVIGLTNDDAVSEEYRPLKQIVEIANRTFKASYRVKCGFDTPEGATYGVALWVAYYNFLRPHKLHKWKRPLNIVDELSNTKNMPVQPLKALPKALGSE